MTKTLKIKAEDIAKNIDKFDDYAHLVLIDGDFDECLFNRKEYRGEEIKDRNLKESIFFEKYLKLINYHDRFESIKTIHMINWWDNHCGLNQTFLELSEIFPNVEKIIIEDFENELWLECFAEFVDLKEIKQINASIEYNPSDPYTIKYLKSVKLTKEKK